MLCQRKDAIQDESSLSASNSWISFGFTCPGCCLHVPQMSVQDRDQGFIDQVPCARGEQLHPVVDKQEVGKGEGKGV